jgi:hypothetical protein
MINSAHHDAGPGEPTVAERQPALAPKHLSAFATVRYVIESIGMGVCIGFTAICWGADFCPDIFHMDHMSAGARANLLSPAGSVTACTGLVLSFVAFRQRRILSILTWLACVLWAVWALLPRF